MNLDLRHKLIVDLGFRASALKDLEAYMSLLWAANEELNLFSRQMPQQELIDNHFIDCLLPLAHFKSELPATQLKAVADLGSGGGMPGVIYALNFPEITVHLYEKSPKKRDFLQKCVRLAPNLKIHSEITSSLAGIQLVTARAFKPIDVILDLTREYYQNQEGTHPKYFLLKGRKEKIDEELLLARKKFKSLQAKVIPLKSPLLEVERHLVLI